MALTDERAQFDAFWDDFAGANKALATKFEKDCARAGWLAALAKVQPANGYQRTPQQEEELSVMRSRGIL